MFYLAPIPKQFVDSSGVPYSDGTVEVFLHNDTRRGTIYLDAEGTTLAPNPAKLDSHGAWIGYVPADVEYDYIIKDKNGNVVFSFSNVVAAVAALTAAINDAVATEKAQREAADATEKSQRESADAALQAEINHRNLDVEFDSDELVFTKGRTVVNG